MTAQKITNAGGVVDGRGAAGADVPVLPITYPLDAADGSVWTSDADGNGSWQPNAGGGTVTSVTAADTSIVVSGTDTIAPQIATGTLDVIATQHPPAAPVPMNSQKLTGLANGSASGDSVAYGQLGSAAFQSSSAFDAAGAAITAQSNAEAASVPASVMTALGDGLYGGVSGAAARLAGNTSATRKFWTSQGTGSAAQAPTLSALQAGDIPQLADYAPTGLTGATTASRYVGATAGGPPTSGTFSTLDWAMDPNGFVWICTSGGSQGTWVMAAGNVPWLPADDGFAAAAFDPAIAPSNGGPAAGVLGITRIAIRYPMTVSNVWVYLASAGSGASTGSFVGLYSGSGTTLTKLQGSSDIGADLQADGYRSCPLSAPVSLTPGYVWAAILINLATMPSLFRVANAGFAGSGPARGTSSGTGQTSLPASITGIGSAGFVFYWFGLS